MEQQSIREILFEYVSFCKVQYECPPLEFANGIQSLPNRELSRVKTRKNMVTSYLGNGSIDESN
jgi:hypothetical protein